MSKPREYTDEEVRDALLAHVVALVNYWEKESRAPDVREKLEGLAFSIFATLDGVSGGMPGFSLAPRPAKEDEAYHKGKGKNWFPRVECEHDIAGELHTIFNRLTKKGEAMIGQVINATGYVSPNGNPVGVRVGADGLGTLLYEIVEIYPGGGGVETLAPPPEAKGLKRVAKGRPYFTSALAALVAIKTFFKTRV